MIEDAEALTACCSRVALAILASSRVLIEVFVDLLTLPTSKLTFLLYGLFDVTLPDGCNFRIKFTLSDGAFLHSWDLLTFKLIGQFFSCSLACTFIKLSHFEPAISLLEFLLKFFLQDIVLED